MYIPRFFVFFRFSKTKMQWRQIIAVTRNLLYATAMNQIVGGLKIYRKQIRKMSLFPVKMFNKLQ